MNSDYIEANDLPGERALLGAILADPSTSEQVWDIIRPDMFWLPQHVVLGGVLHRMHAAKRPIDTATVLQTLIAEGKHEQAGGANYLHSLWSNAYAVEHAPTWAASVRNEWNRRQVVVEAKRLVAKAQNPAFALGELAVEAAEISDRCLDASSPLQPVGGQTILDLVARPYPHVNLIPDLLWRHNRYLFTGGEGLGKSELAAQLTACAVAGLHPFGGEDFRPLTVQVIDAENDDRQASNRYRRLMPIVEKLAPVPVDWSRLMIQNRPEGLTLLKPENVSWVRKVLDTSQPDILVIGSLYKLYAGSNINDEAAAGVVTSVLDDLRIRYDCALVIEAHAGNEKDGTGRRNPRPRGSSMLIGWPEFGHGYLRSKDDPGEEHLQLADVVRFRGDRESDADWPAMVRRGGHDQLPWGRATELDVEFFQYQTRSRAGGF